MAVPFVAVVLLTLSIHTQEQFEAAIKSVRTRTVQELTGWKEPLHEADEEGAAADGEGPGSATAAAADTASNLSAERSNASAMSADSQQQQQQSHPATPGSAGHAKDSAFVTPRTSFSCDPRTKGRARWQNPGGSGSSSVCKDAKALFGGASADDVGGLTPLGSSSGYGSVSRARSEGGGHTGAAGSCGSLTPQTGAATASPAATGTPTPSRSAAEAVESRILAKIASVCTPGPSAAAALRRNVSAHQQAAAGADSSARPAWHE